MFTIRSFGGRLARGRALMRSALPAALLAAGLAGCQSAPETGRSQMLLLSTAEENQLGESAYAEMLAGAKTLTSGADFARVQRVGQRVAEASIRRYPQAVEGFSWQFALIDTPEVNAWMLPGGKSGVNMGLLKVATSDDELAIVMGHEAAHAIARHGGERMSRAMAVEIAAGILNETGQVNPELVDGVLAGYGALGETAFSRNEEAEADQIGIMIAADAGYDPRAAVTFWKKMSALGGAKPPEFLATHPSDEKRASRLEALMPRALTVYEAAKQAGR
jgi:metalloendopeptidase OMA1, mitochondrial